MSRNWSSIVRIVLMIVIASLSPSTAAVVRWKEAISGNWFDESKWHLGRLPTAEDDVAIDLDGSYQITVNGDATVTSIYMPVDTPTLRVTKLLRVHGNMNLNGALILDASSNQDDGLHLDGEGELNGDFNWRNGRLKSSSNGRLTINGMFHITPPSRYYGSNPRVRVDKLQVTITNAAVVDGNTMYFTNDGQFSIAEGAVLNMTNSPTIASEGGGTFLIEGSVNMNSTGTTSVGVNIHNFGAVNIEAGSLSLSGQTTWEGSLSMTTASQITFNGGRHTFLSSSNVVGIHAIRASSSAHVLFSCEKVEFNVIEVEAGTITVEQQTELNLRKLSVWNSARFELYLTKDGDTGNFKVDEISAVNAANIAVVGNVQVKRFIFNLYSGQSAVFDVVGHMSISDQWTWSSGVIQCTEDVVVEGDVSIEGSYRYYHKYARHGRYVFKKKVVLRTESNVNVESDAEFINEKDSEFVVTATGGSFGGGGTFENRGTLFVNSHQTTTYVFTLANFKNVGSVRLESSPGSVFEISADLTPSGTFYIGSDNTMILSGQSALTSDGVFDGPGTLQIQGSNYEFQSINVRTLRINSGSLVVPAPKNRITEQTIPKVYVNAGTLTLPSAETPLLIEELVVAGIGKVATNRHTEIKSLHMSGGTLSGNGVISVTHVFVWEAGVIEGESGHQLIAERDVEVSTQNNKIVHRDLILKGNVTWVATDFDVTVEGKFIITEEASLTIIGDNFMFTTDDPGRGIVENYGNLEVNIPFGKFRLDLEFFNYGKMTVVAGDIELMSKHASIEGTVEFSDLTSSMLITGGNHRIVPDSYPEQGLGKLSVSDADLQVVDCNWAEVTINNGADVNVTYRTIVQPIMEKLVVTGGRVSISALTEGSLRSKDVACKGGQVTFYGDVIATKVTISDGILENQDKLEIVGDLVWIAGTVRGSQFGQTKMSIFGTMKLIGDSEKSLEEQSLEIHTEGVWFGSGNIMMSKSTTLVVMPGGTLTSKASGQFTDRDSTNVISNRGNFIIDSQSTTTSFVRFENEGVLTVSENAVFVLRGDSRSSGQVTVSRSADLHFLGGLHRWYGDPDTGSVEGSILVSDAEVQMFHFNVPGDLKAMDSGILTLLTNREEQGLNTIYIDEDATININSAKKVARHFISRVVIGSGILNVGLDMTIEGATLLTKNAHLVCTRQVDVGELEWRGGSIEGDRKSELQVQDLQIDGKEEKTLIHKVIKLSKDAKMAGIGRFSMLGDATMNIESQAQVDILSSLTITSQKGMIRNYGQLNIVSRYSGNSGTASIEGNFLNNGTLSCRKGANLRISGTSQIDGKTEVSSGSSLEFSDGEHVLVASSVVEGEGTLRVFRAPRTLYVKSADIRVGIFHVTATATAVIQVPGITLTEVVVEGTLRISEDAVRVNVLTVNGGTVSVLKDTIVDRLVFNYGTIDLNANLACRVFHWNGGEISGKETLTSQDARISQLKELIISKAILKLNDTATFQSGFTQALYINDGGTLIVEKGTIFDVYEETDFRTSTGTHSEFDNKGKITFHKPAYIRMKVTNEGHIITSGSFLNFEENVKNFGNIQMSQNTEVKIRSLFSDGDSSIFGEGVLRVTGGTSKISPSVLDVSRIKIEDGTVDFKFRDGSGSVPKTLDVVSGSVGIDAEEGVALILDTVKIDNGNLNLRVAMEIANLTMTGGNFEIRDDVNVDRLDFTGGTIQSPSSKTFTILVQQLYFHHHIDTVKKIQHLTMKVGQKASWKEIPLIEDSFCMENSGKLVILEGATFIVDGLRNAYKCSNSGVGVITNYGTVEVIETSSKAPRAITHLKTSADFRNFGSVIVDRNCKVSFLATATLDGTFSSGVNSTVEFNNHHSSSDLNLNCTWLEVTSSKVVLAQPLSIESVTLGNTEAYLILTNRNNLNEVTYNISYVKITGGTLDLRANIHISHLDMHGGSMTGHTVQYSQIYASVTKADIRDSSSFSHIDQITFEDVNFYGHVVSFGSSNAVFTKKSSLLTFLIFSLSGGANITNQADSLMQVNGETVYEKCSGVDRCSLFNYGRIDVYGPSLSVLADFYNYGTVVATGGKVSVDVVTPDAVQINGVYEMRGVNQKLTFNEPYEEVSTASYTGQAQLDENSHFEDGSTLTVTGGTLKMTPLSSAYDSIVNGLNVIVEGGTVLFNESSSTTGTRLKINSFVITSGEVVLDGNLADISSIDMNGGSLLGSGTVLKFVWKSGNFKDADIDIIDLELHSGSDKAIINSALNVRRHLTNSYTNTLTLSRDSSLTNGINSRFSIIAPLTINSGEDDGSILLNKGNISISTVLGQEVIFDVQFNSTGGIELSGGVLKLVKDSLMSASIDMKSGTRLQFDDGEHELSASSSVTGNGKIRVQDSALLTSSTNNVVIDKFESSGNAFLKGSSCIGILLVLDGSVELNGGLEANEGISIGFLQVYGGTLQCPGLAAINGPATLTSGQVFVTGTLYANGDLNIGDDVTTVGNIARPPDASCSSITDCSSCIAPCQWNPITNLCIAQSRSGPQCHQADCSVPSLCYGYDSNARCVANGGCTWCQWAERCVPEDLCVKSDDSVFWANTNGGDWNSAGSWFNSSTPSDDSDVFIGQHDADYTVQVTSDTNVKSITIGVPCEERRIPMCDHIQELSVQSTLRVSDRILVHKTGHLTLKGTLSIDGTITIYGKMTWRWGTLTGDGNVTVFGTLDIFNDWYHYYRYTHNVLRTKIANRGVLHYRNTRNQLVFNEGGVITNEHTGLIYLSSTWTVDSGVLYNHGTIIASIGGELQFGPQIFNHGTFELKVGKVKFVSGMFCSGILNLADGTEFLLMNVVYDIASTCRIEAQGAKLATSGATVNFDPEFYAVESLSLTANSIFVANQTIHVSYMYWDRVTFSGSGDIIVDDLLEWKGATIEGKKDITVNGEMRLLYPERYSYRRTKVIKRGHLVLKGRNFITADDIVLQLSENAAVDFDSMASVYVSESKPFTIQSDSSMCQVTNYGSIIVDGTISLSTDFQNHGNLSIERGRMTFSKNSYFGSGQVTSFATGTVEFHGSNHMFLVDSSLFLDGHVSMQAQSLVINSSICHHIGSISSSSGNIEISDQSDIRTIGSINLYRANVFLQSLHGGQVDIKYAELRRDGRLYLRTSAKLNTVTFSEYSYTGYLYLGSSVNSYEIYNAVNWVHGYGQFVGETTSDKPTLRITGSFQRHGRQSTYIRSVNLEIYGNLYHTDDGDLIFSDDTNVYMEEDSCVSLRGSYWSVSGSGTKNITNYGSINVLQGSTLNVPFTNYGTVNVNARTSLYVWSSSLFATNKVTILPKGSINFAKGATHAVAADCVFEIHEEGLIRVHDRDTKFNITQANYIKGLEILGTSAIVHANATTGKLSIGYLRLDYTNSFNFYGRELYINRLHWEEGYLNLNGGTMDVGQLLFFWGTRYAKASLNNGVARLKSQHDLHEYIGRSGQSRQYVIVNGHLILESGETTAFFAEPLYIEGTGQISSYRNIYVPPGNTIEVYPEFRCHANCTVGGILNLRSGGEIDNSVLHFIDYGHINILGSNFNLSDVTLLGKGTIYASSGKLTIRGQSSSKSGVSTDIHVYVSQGECMVSYTDDPTFIDSVTMTDSGSMTLTGTQIEVMSVSFIPDYSYNTKLIVDATQSATVTDILLRSYRGGASMDVSGALIVKRKMTWNSGHINGEIEISPDAELFFQTNNFKQIQNGMLNIHGTAYSYDDMYLTLIDSAVNVTGTWYFVNGFEFRSNCQNDCLFVNYGVLEVAAPDERLTIESGITLNNHGKLNIIHGTVIIKKIESLGEVHAGQDSSLTIHDMRSTLNNSSSLHFENSTLTVSGDSHVDVDGLLANIQHLYMDGGTLSIVNADEFQVATITIDGGTLVVNTDFYVNTLVMRGGLVTGNGILRTDNMVLYAGNIEIGYPDSYPGIRELEDWRSQERQTRDVDDYSDYNSFDYDSYAGDPPGPSYLVVSEDLLLASSTSHIYGMFVTSGVVRQTSNNRIYLERNGVFLSENRVEIFSSLTIGGDSSGLFINNGTIVVDSGETSEGLSVNVPFINFGDIEVLSGKFYTTPTRYEVSRYYGSLDVSSLGLLTFSFGEHYFLKNSSISVQGSMELPHSSYNTLVRVERDAQSVYIKKLTMWQDRSSVELSASESRIEETYLSGGLLLLHGDVKVDACQLSSDGNLRIRKTTEIGKLTFLNGYLYGMGQRPKIFVDDFGWFDGRIYTTEDNFFNVDVRKNAWFVHDDTKEMDYNAILTIKEKASFASRGSTRLRRFSQIIIDENARVYQYEGNIIADGNDAQVINRGTHNTGDFRKNAHLLLNVMLQSPGQINVQEGNLRLGKGGSLSAVSTGALSSVQIIEGSFTVAPESLKGEGTLKPTGGVLAFSSGVLSVPLILQRGTIAQINADAVVTATKPVTIQGGTLRVNGLLNITKNLEFMGGTIEGDGILKIRENTTILIKDSTENRDMTAAFVRNFGTMTVTSQLRLNAGEFRNEESGIVTIKDSGSITGNGILTNVGLVEATQIHSERVAQITTGLENVWVIHANDCPLQFTQSSPRQHFTVHSRVIGERVLFRGTVRANGVYESTADINGNLAVTHALVLNANITWSGGNIYGEDSCQSRYYNPASSSLIIPPCPDQYILNKGHLQIIDTSSGRNLGEHLEFVNQGKLSWLGGEIHFHGAVINAPSGEILIQGPSQYAPKSYRYTSFPVQNHGSMTVNMTRADLSSCQFANFKAIQLLDGAHLVLGSFSQQSADSLVSIAEGASMEIPTLTITSGKILCGGNIQGHLHIENAVLNIQTCSISRNLVLGEKSVMEVDIFSTSEYDNLIVDEDVTVNGGLKVSWNNGVFRPRPGNVFQIIQFSGTQNGQFAYVESMISTVDFEVSYGHNNVTIAVL